MRISFVTDDGVLLTDQGLIIQEYEMTPHERLKIMLHKTKCTDCKRYLTDIWRGEEGLAFLTSKLKQYEDPSDTEQSETEDTDNEESMEDIEEETLTDLGCNDLPRPIMPDSVNQVSPDGLGPWWREFYNDEGVAFRQYRKLRTAQNLTPDTKKWYAEDGTWEGKQKTIEELRAALDFHSKENKTNQFKDLNQCKFMHIRELTTKCNECD